MTTVQAVRPGDDARPKDSAPAPHGQRIQARTLFISDIHLGTRASQADLLLGFLRRYDARTVFLVGDIVEQEWLLADRYWDIRQAAAIAELLAMAERGTRIVYIPGNHDHLARRCAGMAFGGIEIALNALHTGADGRRYLVTHGDQFDAVARHAPWLANVGHAAYHALLALNTRVNAVRRWLGLDYWSLSAWAKRKVKQAVNHISNFEASLAAEARKHGADGVVCGHIHHAADRDVSGIRYLNAGDWVETCSAIVESMDGQISILCCKARRPASPQVAPSANDHDFRGDYAGVDNVRRFQLWLRRAVRHRAD